MARNIGKSSPLDTKSGGLLFGLFLRARWREAVGYISAKRSTSLVLSTMAAMMSQ